MFTVLFSGTSYNRLGVKFVLGSNRKPSVPSTSNQENAFSKPNPEPESAIQTPDLNLPSERIRIPNYWDEGWSPTFEQKMESALNRKSLETLMEHIKELIQTGESWLNYFQNNYNNTETSLGNYAGSYVQLLSSVTQLIESLLKMDKEKHKCQMS